MSREPLWLSFQSYVCFSSLRRKDTFIVPTGVVRIRSLQLWTNKRSEQVQNFLLLRLFCFYTTLTVTLFGIRGQIPDPTEYGGGGKLHIVLVFRLLRIESLPHF